MLLPLLCACPGTLDDPSHYRESACPDIEAGVFQVRCAGSQCHGGSRPAAGLDLRSPGAASRMAGRAGRCGPLLIDPVEPEASLLWRKTGDAPPDDCPTPMPIVGKPLDGFERACLLTWIEDAAASAPAAAGPLPR